MTLADDLRSRIDYVKKRLDPEGPLSYTRYPQHFLLTAQDAADRTRIAVVQAEVAELERYVTSVWHDLPKAAEENANLFESVDEELNEIWQAYNKLFEANNPQTHFAIPLRPEETSYFTHARKRPSRPTSAETSQLKLQKEGAIRWRLYLLMVVFLILPAICGSWHLDAIRAKIKLLLEPDSGATVELS